MSLENNVLIDGNGNAFDSIEAEEYPNFFTSLWKKMWPSREVKCKYELKERTRSQESTPELKRAGSNPFLSIFYGLSSLGKSDRERCDSPSSCSSTDNTPRPSPNRRIMNKNETLQPDIDTLYSDAPKTQTNRKVYMDPAPAPAPAPAPPPAPAPVERVKTRRESILSNNRRYPNPRRNANININENPGSPLYNKNNRRHIDVVIDEENENSDFNETYSSKESVAVHKKVTFKALPTNEENDNDDSQSLDLRDREPARENFYNVNELNMEALWKSGKQSDIAIHCRGSVFPAHSFVLKAQSGFFRRELFMKSDTNRLTINDIQPDDMQALLQYMYTGRIDSKYCEVDGCYTSRFEYLLQDYDVPLPENSQIALIVTDYSSGSE